MRPTKRPRPSRNTRKQIRLAALRSWQRGETLNDVAERLHVRPSWLTDALALEFASVFRHFEKGRTAADVVELARLEMYLKRRHVPDEAARAFVGYVIRRIYADRTWRWAAAVVRRNGVTRADIARLQKSVRAAS